VNTAFMFGGYMGLCVGILLQNFCVELFRIWKEARGGRLDLDLSRTGARRSLEEKAFRRRLNHLMANCFFHIQLAKRNGGKEICTINI